LPLDFCLQRLAAPIERSHLGTETGLRSVNQFPPASGSTWYLTDGGGRQAHWWSLPLMPNSLNRPAMPTLTLAPHQDHRRSLVLLVSRKLGEADRRAAALRTAGNFVGFFHGSIVTDEAGSSRLSIGWNAVIAARDKARFMRAGIPSGTDQPFVTDRHQSRSSHHLRCESLLGPSSTRPKPCRFDLAAS
jgi:hypothetical protein